MSKQHDHDQDNRSDISLRVKAVESLLIEKGLLDPSAIDKLVDAYEHKIGPHNAAALPLFDVPQCCLRPHHPRFGVGASGQHEQSDG
jgi:hypothetical protein